jgi:phosphohistidine phosphatase
MALFLVQHGKSLPKDIDADPSLSEEGTLEAKRIAEVARGYGVHVSEIWHSGKKRARQTADIFAHALDPENGVKAVGGLNPMDDVAAFARHIGNEEDIMLVGHLPFLAKLTSYLITGTVDRSVFKFQNGGILCLDRDLDTRTWMIKWSLMPHIK